MAPRARSVGPWHWSEGEAPSPWGPRERTVLSDADRGVPSDLRDAQMWWGESSQDRLECPAIRVPRRGFHGREAHCPFSAVTPAWPGLRDLPPLTSTAYPVSFPDFGPWPWHVWERVGSEGAAGSGGPSCNQLQPVGGPALSSRSALCTPHKWTQPGPAKQLGACLLTLTGVCGSCWVSVHGDAGVGSVCRVNPWPGVLSPGTGADYSPTSGEGEQWGLHLASQVGWTHVKGGAPARPMCPRGPGVLGPTRTHTADSCSLRGALCPQLITPGDGPWGRKWGPHLHPSKQTTVPHRTRETRRGVLLTHVGA